MTVNLICSGIPNLTYINCLFAKGVLMNTKEKQVSRKTLTYLICLDMVKSAISSIGSANTVDPIAAANIVAAKLTEAAEKKERK